MLTSSGHIAEAPRTRGGDHRAEERGRRNEAMRALADLLAPGVPIEASARAIVSRTSRYQPLPVEHDPIRLLLRDRVDIGMPGPGADRTARILRSGREPVV